MRVCGAQDGVEDGVEGVGGAHGQVEAPSVTYRPG